MAAGRRSTMPFHTARLRSYVWSPGKINSPPNSPILVAVPISRLLASKLHPLMDAPQLVTGEEPLTNRSEMPR